MDAADKVAEEQGYHLYKKDLCDNCKEREPKYDNNKEKLCRSCFIAAFGTEIYMKLGIE